MACYLINDLVNRELIRRDFKFLQPNFIEEVEEKKEVKSNECEEEDNFIEIDNPLQIDLARYLREDIPDTQISLKSAQIAEAEKEYFEGAIDPKEWEKEYKSAKEKLKDAALSNPKDRHLYNTHKLTRLFQRVKDIMSLTGNDSINNYIFIIEDCLKTINTHEKRINANIATDLVTSMNKEINNKTHIAEELMNLRDIVKKLIDKLDSLALKNDKLTVRVYFT